MVDDFRLGDWLIQPALNLATRNGEKVHIRPKVMDLLVLLASQPHTVLSKNLILEKLWGTEFVSESALTSVVTELRQVLEDDARRPWLLETIPKRGYRLIAGIRPVIETLESARPDTLATLVESPHPSRSSWPSRRLVMMSLLVTVLAGVGAYWRGKAGHAPESDRAVHQIRAIAVLPFRNLSPNAADDWLPDALTDGLISELGQLDGFERVIAYESAIRYKPSTWSLRDIGKDLQVQGVVTGAVTRDGDRLRISAELIDVGTERQLWTDTYTQDARDLPDMQRQVVRDIVREVRIALTPSQRRRLESTARRPDAEALELLFKARAASRVVKYRETVRYCELALARDPDLAAAWAELAQTLVFQAYGNPRLPVIPRARAAAERALELDPENGVARAALGRIRLQVDWDWDGAGRELRSAVALDPQNPNVRWQYAFYLGAVGRFDESVQEARQSLSLDPVSPFAYFQLGFELRVARQYGAAVDQMTRAIELAPDMLFFVDQRALSRALNGDCALALADLRAVEGQTSFDGFIEATCGSREEARKIAAAALRDGTCLADVYAVLGDFDAAFSCLERRFAKHDFELAQVPTEPRSAALRADPRFDHLLRQMGYPR